MSEYHSALDYHLAFDGINNVFADTRNDTKNAEDDGIVTSKFCTDNLLFLFLAVGNMHRLPTKSKTRRDKAGQRTRKGCQGS